ncbi:MAG: hypothetical protein RQ757_07070 [Pseudomonadales bacterium]|nr:hypothetical protein [Pseudomonadales bacterium]
MREQMNLEDEFTFGKHRGEQLEDVIHDDPGYITWLADKEIVTFSDEARTLMEQRKLI